MAPWLNGPDSLTRYSLAPGRIDRKIKVNRPDKKGAREIFKIYDQKMRLRLSDEAPFGSRRLTPLSDRMWNIGTALMVLAGWASLLYRIRAEERVLARDAGWPRYVATARYRLLPGAW